MFSDAQKSPAGHRKLVVGLRKIQETCCYEQIDRGRKLQEAFGEDDFNVEVARCVIRLMSVKKTEGVGDRVVQFLGLFLRHANSKGEQERKRIRTFEALMSARCRSCARGRTRGNSINSRDSYHALDIAHIVDLAAAAGF